MSTTTDEMIAVSASVERELATITPELSRADGKASTLLALAGLAAGVAVNTLTGAHLPAPGRAAGVVAVAALVAAMLLLARAIRPDLRGRYGFMAWVGANPIEVAVLLATDPAEQAALAAHRLVAVSELAGRKYRRIRHAVDLITVAIGLLAAAALTGAVGS